MPSATVSKITKEASGRVLIQFGKRGYEFANITAMQNFVREALAGSPETLEQLAMALMLSRQPSLANPTAFEGHAVTVDFSLASWGKIT